MKYYFNKFIEYLVDNNIEITTYCFLILKKIKELIESGEIEKGQGKMSKKLKEYFFDEFNISEFSEENINANLTLLKFEDIESSENEYSIERIDTVQIKNFRGFGEYSEEEGGCCFDFRDKNKIILYGPNGSGKSCFAEALEYSLTGDIKECVRKGKNIYKYVKHKNKTPDIFINDEKMDLSLGEKERLKKCFIEKNRITEFSLFKSEDTGVKDYRAVLTLLLGLGELNGFIGSFVQKDSFSLSNKEKVEKIEKDIENAEKDIKDKKAIFLDKKNKLEELKTYLIGIGLLNEDSLEKNDNFLNELKIEIESYEKQLKLPNLLKNLQEIKKDEIIDLEKQFDEKNKELEQLKKELDEKKTDINMKKLYEAIRNLSVDDKDVCPACHTKRENWKQDPFDNADKELKNMDKIIELESKYDTIKEAVEIKLPNEIKGKYMVLDANISKLQDFDEDINRDNYFEKLEDLGNSIDKEKIEKIVIDKDKKQQELKNIEYDLKQYDDLTEEIGKGEPSIEPEKAEEMKLKLDKEKDKDNFLKNINDGYGKFHDNIDIFYNDFIKQETENLRNDVCEYYKKINKHDDESEQIQSISTKEGYSEFEILLHFSDGKEEDAVNYLSEGHLKALGLSILWADMKKNNVPFMIFDDVVNAIDAEHRSNIIEILHTDEFLSNKQLILTVHDRLFWEKYCNAFGTSDNSRHSIILKHNKTIGINYELYNEINYQEKIEFSIEKYDLRQAVIFSRIWFETKIYEYLRNNGTRVDGYFKKNGKSLVLTTDMNTLFEKFDSKIRHEMGYENISESYNILRDLSINGKVNWNILNQEAHASDEQTYNIIESRTSNEVSRIYDALLDVIPFIQKMIDEPCDQQ